MTERTLTSRADNEISAERSPEVNSLLRDMEVITEVEDRVIRKGARKTLPRSLLFFAAEDVGKARYLEDKELVRLYDWDVSKPCELQETQEALTEFAEKYNKDPNEVTDRDAIKALSELSDVTYNLAQLIDNQEFQSIIESFSVHEDLFSHLLLMAKAKYSYRYLDIDALAIAELMGTNFSQDKQIILKSALPERRKDVDYEIDSVLTPLYNHKRKGFLIETLVNNWSHIDTILHAVYSKSRMVALELDKEQNTKNGDENSLEGQLVRSIKRIPSLNR